MADEYFCETCGKRTAQSGKDVPRFCSHCGGALSVVSTPDDDIIPFADDAIPAPAPKIPPVIAPPPVPPSTPASPPPVDVKIPPIVQPAAPPPVPHTAKGVTDVSPPAKVFTPVTPKAADELEFREQLIRCPNCGKNNPATAEVCTNCGYSRSLGRTLTTRVRGHEPEPAAPPPEKISPRGIEAEKEYEARKRRAALNPLSDQFRLWFALLLCAGLAVVILVLPKYPYQPPDIELHGLTIRSPEFRMQDALGSLAAVFLLGAPLLTFAVRVTFLITKLDNPAHMTFLRAAGTLALLMLTLIGFFILQFTRLHLDSSTMTIALYAALAAIGILGTWYLQNIRFFVSILITFISLLISGGVILFCGTQLPQIVKWLNL